MTNTIEVPKAARSDGYHFIREVKGTASGNERRVAIGFTEKQFAAINTVAKSRNKSFSKVVADLVDLAIEDILA